MGSKVINDVVHGHMEFHPLLVSIMDTPQFQRMRYIKQTGPCYLVHPGATHTRFEHSLGTAFLAGKLMGALNQERGFFGENAEKETLCVQIAGLCHDLGHGPFSHTWENFLGRCGIKWNHEQLSVDIFLNILEESTLDKKSGNYVTIRELFVKYGMEEYIDVIKRMILDDEEIPRDVDKRYLFQIISNKENGVDVDKWDYLLRDSRMVNFPINFDCDRIFHFCRIIPPVSGDICFRDKEISNLRNMYLARGWLHEKVYQHRKVKIIEEMLIDAFFLAKDRLKLTDTSLKNMLRLTDHIYQKILYDDFGDDENMAKAREILERIQRRDLYKCLATQEVDFKDIGKKKLLKKIEEAIFKRLNEVDKTLNGDSIRCSLISVKMLFGDGLPLEGIKLYSKEDEYNAENFLWPNSNLKPDLRKLNLREVMVLYKPKGKCEEYIKPLLEKVITETCKPFSDGEANPMKAVTVNFRNSFDGPMLKRKKGNV